jgi:hypothetical protein
MELQVLRISTQVAQLLTYRKTVKHMVINDWPLGTLQQQDMGLSFVWDGPAGQMGSYFSGLVTAIIIQLFRQTNPDIYPPTSPFAQWNADA